MPSPPLLGAFRSRGETLFRVWAPQARAVEVVFEDSREPPLALSREAGGYFGGATSARVSLYKYRVDGTGPWPDPCSRFQPQGVHGPSMIVDPAAFNWSDAQWHGVRLHGQVIYELHIGTFTPEGTSRRRRRQAPVPAAARHHDARSHAGRRMPGTLELGLRRRAAVRALSCLRRSRGAQALRRPRARARARRHPRRRLQPSRAGRQLPQVLQPALLQHAPQDRVGRSPELRRRARAGHARLHPRQRALLAERVSSRRPAAGCNAVDLRRQPPAHPRRDRAHGARRRAATLDHRRVRERAAARRAAAAARTRRLRTRRDVERRFSPRGESRTDRYARRLLRRLHRTRAGIPVVRAPRLSVPGPVVPVAEADARQRRCRVCPRNRRSSSCRTTTRSATRSSAIASWRAQPLARIAR